MKALLKIAMRFYHGSPRGDIKELTPRKDPRTGHTGVFLADEPHSSEIFSLLKNRSKSNKNITTKGGNFISGEVMPHGGKLLPRGYLYELDVPASSLKEWKKGSFLSTESIKITKPPILVKREEVLRKGWTVKK